MSVADVFERGPTVDEKVRDLFAKTKADRAAVDAKQARRLAQVKRHDRADKKEDREPTSKVELRTMRKAYEAGNMVALWDAVALCTKLGGTQPWVLQGTLKEFDTTFVGRPSRRDSPATRFRQDMKDYYRWATTHVCIDSVGWNDRAYKMAARLLRGTTARGSWGTMKAAQAKVSRGLKTHPHRYYIPRYIRPSLS